MEPVLSDSDSEKDQRQLTREERIRQDRQRFIGMKTMVRLLKSKILITPMNGPNTELAKNMVLAGANVWVYDPAPVSADDFQTNFLIAHNDLGRPRGQTILKRLNEMNPSAKNELITVDIKEKLNNKDLGYFKQFKFLVTSTLDFEEQRKWYELAMELNRPYYNLASCGKYGWTMIGLGSRYKFVKQNQEEDIIDEHHYRTFNDVKIGSVSYDKLFDETDAHAKPLYQAIIMLKHASENGWKIDPFNVCQETLGKMVQWAVDKFGPANKALFENVAKQQNIDFCPVYSVTGSVISQQIIKVLSRNAEPGINWFLYDSEECYGVIYRTKAQQAHPRTELLNKNLHQRIDPKQ